MATPRNFYRMLQRYQCFVLVSDAVIGFMRLIPFYYTLVSSVRQ